MILQVSIIDHYHFVHLSDEESRDEPFHCFLGSVIGLLGEMPSHLLFNPSFMRFLHGSLMLPFVHLFEYNNANSFPGMCLPSFRSIIKIEKIIDNKWFILYHCNCDAPRTLSCFARMRVLVYQWVALIRLLVETTKPDEPHPTVMIKNFSYITYRWHRLDKNLINPITCIYQLMEYHNFKVAVGRSYKNGLVYYHLHIHSYSMEIETKHLIEGIIKSIRKLPFYFSLSYYPFFYIDYDVANENDQL